MPQSQHKNVLHSVKKLFWGKNFADAEIHIFRGRCSNMCLNTNAGMRIGYTPCIICYQSLNPSKGIVLAGVLSEL